MIRYAESKRIRTGIITNGTLLSDKMDDIFDLIERAKAIGIKYINLHRLFDLYGVDPGVKSLSHSNDIKLFKDARLRGTGT